MHVGDILRRTSSCTGQVFNYFLLYFSCTSQGVRVEKKKYTAIKPSRSCVADDEKRAQAVYAISPMRHMLCCSTEIVALT
jgi:hypothetical protein